jgi:hypothetical protein
MMTTTVQRPAAARERRVADVQPRRTDVGLILVSAAREDASAADAY